jgi:hypothetical protein
MKVALLFEWLLLLWIEPTKAHFESIFNDEVVGQVEYHSFVGTYEKDILRWLESLDEQEVRKFYEYLNRLLHDTELSVCEKHDHQADQEMINQRKIKSRMALND